MIREIRHFFTRQWWTFTWGWIREGGCLHRCKCCDAYNRSVSYWPFKGCSWFCGECAYLCDGKCDGVPFRKLGRR